MQNVKGKLSVLLEEDKAFSQCALWQLQRDFFINEGVNAWDSQVPFYITSNPSIANGYATMMLRFMQDWCKSSEYKKNKPFYILELGAGSGRFGFYVLKRLLELKVQLGLDHIKFVYVLTDFATSNIEYMMKHSAWQTYIEQGAVDFSCFDVENDKQITLELSGETLGESEFCNPIIATANYLFDSLRHDIFRVENGELYAALTHLSTTEDNIKVDSSDVLKVYELDRIDVDFRYKKVTDRYYDNDKFNDLLTSYCEQLEDAHFIFPIGGVNCLENLKAMGNGRCFTVAADKGNCELYDIAYSNTPGFSLHGNCFSMQVNFHALTRYSSFVGGDYITQATQTGISSVAMLSGLNFSGFAETRHAVDNYLTRYSPATLFKLYAYIRDSAPNCPPDTFLALMNLTDWDPHIFNKYIEILLDKIPECSFNTLRALHEGIPKIIENFYHMPGAIDTFIGIALFYQELCDYEQALVYYDLSIEYYGNADHVSYNQGLCYYYLEENQQALEKFKQALELNPGFEYARYWRDNMLENTISIEDGALAVV